MQINNNENVMYLHCTKSNLRVLALYYIT